MARSSSTSFATDGGDLVNVSSVAGRVAPAGFADYADSKRAAKEATTATHIEPADIAGVIAFAELS